VPQKGVAYRHNELSVVALELLDIVYARHPQRVERPQKRGPLAVQLQFSERRFDNS
jgi:hypothetical protein